MNQFLKWFVQLTCHHFTSFGSQLLLWADVLASEELQWDFLPATAWVGQLSSAEFGKKRKSQTLKTIRISLWELEISFKETSTPHVHTYLAVVFFQKHLKQLYITYGTRTADLLQIAHDTEVKFSMIFCVTMPAGSITFAELTYECNFL